MATNNDILIINTAYIINPKKANHVKFFHLIQDIFIS